MEDPRLGVWGKLYARCRGGLAPAEALPQTLRHQLFRELRGRGLTVVEIAALTMSTEYTVDRILNMEDS